LTGQSNNLEFILPKDTHYILYTLIVNQFATLVELRDVYDIYEVLELYEMCVVSLYNKTLSMKGVMKNS